MKKITMPEWTKLMPDNAMLSSKEVLVIFGYKAASRVGDYVENGRLPKPTDMSWTYSIGTRGRGNRGKPLQWSVGSLRKIAANG